MTRTIHLEAEEITYQEHGSYTLFMHVVEIEGSSQLLMSVARSKAEAEEVASDNGDVIHTQALYPFLANLEISSNKPKLENKGIFMSDGSAYVQ